MGHYIRNCFSSWCSTEGKLFTLILALSIIKIIQTLLRNNCFICNYCRVFLSMGCFQAQLFTAKLMTMWLLKSSISLMSLSSSHGTSFDLLVCPFMISSYVLMWLLKIGQTGMGSSKERLHGKTECWGLTVQSHQTQPGHIICKSKIRLVPSHTSLHSECIKLLGVMVGSILEQGPSFLSRILNRLLNSPCLWVTGGNPITRFVFSYELQSINLCHIQTVIDSFFFSGVKTNTGLREISS